MLSGLSGLASRLAFRFLLEFLPRLPSAMTTTCKLRSIFPPLNDSWPSVPSQQQIGNQTPAVPMLLGSCHCHHCWPPGRPAEVCPLHSAPHPRRPQFLSQCLLNEWVSLGSEGKGLGGKEGGWVSKTPEKIHFKDRVLTPHSFTGQPSLGQEFAEQDKSHTHDKDSIKLTIRTLQL